MVFGCCPICTEQFTDDIVTTKCGHIFHNLCVCQWLKNNRACPSCRSFTKVKDLIKLFPDSADESFRISQVPDEGVNSEAMQKCLKLNDKLNTRASDLESFVTQLKSENDEKDREITKLVNAKGSLEREYSNTKQTCSNLKTKMKYMVEDTEKTKVLNEKVKLLERDVRAMRGLKVILEDSQEECEEIIRNTSDPMVMAQYVTGLKRDYNMLQRTKIDVQQQAEDLQRKLSYSRIKIQNLKEEVDEMKRDKDQVEQDLSVAERRNESLCKKIGIYEDKSLNNTNLLNVSNPKCKVRRLIDHKTPIQLVKRKRTEQSTPVLFDDSFEDITNEFVQELSRDHELDALAAELGVNISVAESPGSSKLLPKQECKEDNLFTNVGFDGLGGTTRIKKPLNRHAAFNKAKPFAAKKTALGNFFKKL